MRRRIPIQLLALGLSAVLFAGCMEGGQDVARPGGTPGEFRPSREAPELPGTIGPSRPSVQAKKHMVVTAHPLASEAGRAVLRAGGSAMDAALAAQLMLNVVEPQASGIGGGAFLVHYAAKTKAIEVYDGRETAPAGAKPDMFLEGGRPLSFGAAVRSGVAVGVPGLLRMMEMAHRDHGRTAWAKLFDPAITAAERGTPVSQRLAEQLASERASKASPAMTALFYPGGRAPAAGTVLANPALAETFRTIARDGANAFYEGAIARDMVAAVAAAERPGTLTLADLAGYRAIKREPLCGVHRGIRLCGPPPPSSGPLAVLQILGLWRALPNQPADVLEVAHAFAEVSRLAFADRDAYVADPAFVKVPTESMLADIYLGSRALQVGPRGGVTAKPGLGQRASLPQEGGPSTTHLAVIDGEGNMVSLTSTIEQQFGSGIAVRGFLLNNEMTDFAFRPEADGRPVANRVEPGKRPRSSMAPMLGVDAAGRPLLAIGSPGGPQIIAYVAKALLGIVEWRLDVQQAIDLPNIANRNGTTELERDTPAELLVDGLRDRGHEVRLIQMPSGLNGFVTRGGTIYGGSDPRREGVALGD